MGTKTVCTPEDIRSLAKYFGVDLESANEYHLLPVIKAASNVSLPHNWQECNQTDGQRYYFHKRKFTITSKHPLDSKFYELIAKKRKHGKAVDVGKRTWMEVTDQIGETLYHNFADGASSVQPPSESLLLEPLPQEEVPKDSSPPPYRPKKPNIKVPDMNNIRCLYFKSWWNEDQESSDLTLRDNGCQVGGGLKKRYLGLVFDLQKESFFITIQNDDQDLKMHNMKHVTARNGAPLQCWDLHVGSKLDILGKAVTLMQANLETSLWIDWHKKKLLDLKLELQTLAQKYKYRPFQNAIAFTKDCGLPGGASLRSLIDQISQIILGLSKYRPVLAAKYRQKLDSILSSDKKENLPVNC